MDTIMLFFVHLINKSLLIRIISEALKQSSNYIFVQYKW